MSGVRTQRKMGDEVDEKPGRDRGQSHQEREAGTQAGSRMLISGIRKSGASKGAEHRR